MIFKVSNGVRQSGVLSPKFFAIYIDDLSQDLAMCKSGCHINKQCMNHVMYADDICLLAPSFLFSPFLYCIVFIRFFFSKKLPIVVVRDVCPSVRLWK